MLGCSSIEERRRSVFLLKSATSKFTPIIGRVLNYNAMLSMCLSPSDTVKEALEDLATVGGVSVTLSYIGIAVGSDGVKFLPDGDDTSIANSTSLFPVWTVTFDGECSFAEDVWTSCPANIGDLEVRILGFRASDANRNSHENSFDSTSRAFQLDIDQFVWFSSSGGHKRSTRSPREYQQTNTPPKC